MRVRYRNDPGRPVVPRHPQRQSPAAAEFENALAVGEASMLGRDGKRAFLGFDKRINAGFVKAA